MFYSLLIRLFAGVLTRCLASLEEKDIDGSKSTEASDALREVCDSVVNKTSTHKTKTLAPTTKTKTETSTLKTKAETEVP